MSDLADALLTSTVVDDIQLDLDEVSQAWTLMPVTFESAKVALDAVRYQPNYARTVTTRLCLHFISTIRKRRSSTSITSYLLLVDGCEIAEVEPSGRCDIYYCRPYTYELQLAQKAKESSAFIIDSICKTVDQKSLRRLREDSNLDFSEVPEQVEAAEITPLLRTEEAFVHTKPPVVSSTVRNNRHRRQFDDKQAIAWTSDVWPVEATTLSMAMSPSEKLPNVDSDNVIAIIGIAIVSVYSIAFVMALLIVRRRAQENLTKGTLDEEHFPLSRLDITHTTISATTNINPVVEKELGFLI